MTPSVGPRSGTRSGALEAPQDLIHTNKVPNPHGCLRLRRLTPHAMVRLAVSLKTPESRCFEGRGGAYAKST